MTTTKRHTHKILEHTILISMHDVQDVVVVFVVIVAVVAVLLPLKVYKRQLGSIFVVATAVAAAAAYGKLKVL